jgi:hypothetical protein
MEALGLTVSGESQKSFPFELIYRHILGSERRCLRRHLTSLTRDGRLSPSNSLILEIGATAIVDHSSVRHQGQQ